MKNLIFSLLVLTACNPIDDAVDDARMQCEEVFDQRYDQIRTDIWQQCTNFYETEVIPEFENTINQLLAEFQGILEAFIAEYENELMTRIGCVPDATLAGWDCSNTELCL